MLRRIDGSWYTEPQLQDPKVLKAFGFNPREVNFIVRHGWTELPLLYLGPYLDAIGDEYQPFGVGLDKLDEISAFELLAKDGASDAAIQFNGLRRGDGSQAAPTARSQLSSASGSRRSSSAGDCPSSSARSSGSRAETSS